MTDAALHAAEVAAGAAAARQMIEAKVPGWEIHMIPVGAIEAVVEAVITAVDGVRDAQASPITPRPASAQGGYTAPAGERPSPPATGSGVKPPT